MNEYQRKLLSKILGGEIQLSDFDQSEFGELEPPIKASLIRTASGVDEKGILFFQGLFSKWKNNGRIPLKPNVVESKLFILCNDTAKVLPPLLELFSASYGVHLECDVSEFDSVEQFALMGAENDLKKEGFFMLLLTGEWLDRYFGKNALVSNEQFDMAKKALSSIIKILGDSYGDKLLLCLFPQKASPYPGGEVMGEGYLGWETARRLINSWLKDTFGWQHLFVDVAGALNIAGGGLAYGGDNFIRARIPFEPTGIVSITREISAVIASALGKSHRGVITDFDNTLWGGLIAEDGADTVNCGPDSPEGFDYFAFQQYLKSLPKLGIVWAGLSRNDPRVLEEMNSSRHLHLKVDDFAALEVSFNPKSMGISNLEKRLGFGSEFMVFVDDSLFELAECLVRHPYLDVVRAGPLAIDTTNRIVKRRLFQTSNISSTDLARNQSIKSLEKQREKEGGYDSIECFLKDINIEITIESVDSSNIDRVIQLFQKTNQFNLTTKRHSKKDISVFLRSRESDVIVVSYEDSFGSQGIISSLITQQLNDDCCLIDSWVMSCRVLNRRVEYAIAEWIIERFNGKRIRGEYRPTERNGIVENLYSSLRFKRENNLAEGSEFWILDGRYRSVAKVEHFAKVIDNYSKDNDRIKHNKVN